MTSPPHSKLWRWTASSSPVPRFQVGPESCRKKMAKKAKRLVTDPKNTKLSSFPTTCVCQVICCFISSVNMMSIGADVGKKSVVSCRAAALSFTYYLVDDDTLNIKRRVQQKRKPLDDGCTLPAQVKATEVRSQSPAHLRHL